METEILYKKIYDDLLGGIKSKLYKEGDRLPSEKELASQYGVSRITSKKALEMLADRGYVFRRPGLGTFVSSEAEAIKEVENAGSAQADKRGAPVQKPLIGIIIDSINASFGMEIINGLEYECRRRGMMPLINFTYGSTKNEQQSIRDMLQAGASGLALICVQGKDYNEELLKLYVQHFPVVLIDRRMPGIALPVVTTDNYKAAYELTELLINAGHSKIGYISHSHMETSTIASRFRGFSDALRAHGISTDSSCIIQDMDAYMPKDDDEAVNFQAYRKELGDFIDNHPELTAFFAVEYSIAKMLYSVLYEKNLIGQKQIAYFDGFADPVAPIIGIPHILQNQYQIGVQAIRNLERRMHGEEIPECDFVPYTLLGELN